MYNLTMTMIFQPCTSIYFVGKCSGLWPSVAWCDFPEISVIQGGPP